MDFTDVLFVFVLPISWPYLFVFNPPLLLLVVFNVAVGGFAASTETYDALTGALVFKRLLFVVVHESLEVGERQYGGEELDYLEDLSGKKKKNLIFDPTIRRTNSGSFC